MPPTRLPELIYVVEDEMAIARLPDLRRRIGLLTRADLTEAEHGGGAHIGGA